MQAASGSGLPTSPFGSSPPGVGYGFQGGPPGPGFAGGFPGATGPPANAPFSQPLDLPPSYDEANAAANNEVQETKDGQLP